MPSSRNLSRPRRAKNNPSEVSAPKRLRRLTLHHNVKKTVSFEKGVKKSERIVLKKSEKKASTKVKIKFVSSRIISIHFKQNSYLVYLYLTLGGVFQDFHIHHFFVIPFWYENITYIM